MIAPGRRGDVFAGPKRQGLPPQRRELAGAEQRALVVGRASPASKGAAKQIGLASGRTPSLRPIGEAQDGRRQTGFFVCKGLAMCSFHATLTDDHPPLKLHSGELMNRQGGPWV